MSKRIEVKDLNIYYGRFHAVSDVNLVVEPRSVTAFIGPSGCGKSTVLRTLNRMHEVIPGARCTGEVLLDGTDLYGPGVDPVAVRRVVGMVFQRPNPFPSMSIYENVASGLRLNGEKNRAVLDEAVEKALRGANLWKEVKDRLGKAGVGLSGGQQQRLCIARAIAVQPDVLLMDEPGGGGPHPRTQGALHRSHRHPQHAAGGAGFRRDGLLQPESPGRTGSSGGDRPDGTHLPQPEEEGHGGLHHRSFRVIPAQITVLPALFIVYWP